MMDLKLFTSQDVNWWTGVVWITCGLLWCFYQLFGLSFWRHPFTAEDPLLSKWCNATFPMKKQTHLHVEWSEVSTFTFSYLPDAFIQSDLQMRTIEAIKINRAMICKCYNKSQCSTCSKFLFILLYNKKKMDRIEQASVKGLFCFC